ncbi:MAG TPA: hypothetical protein VGE29_15225 [Prosthecobacter sp.]
MGRTTHSQEFQEAGRQRLEEIDREEAAARHKAGLDQAKAHHNADFWFKAFTLGFGATTLTVTLLLFFGIAPPKRSHSEPAAPEIATPPTRDAASQPDNATDASKNKSLPQGTADTPPSTGTTEKQ